MLEAASSGILITDPTRVDNPIVTCNRAFLEITGYSAEEVVGANCRFLQRDDRDQDAIAELREAVADGKKCRVLLRNYRKDGIMFWNELQVSPVRDDQGRVTHFVGILADVTQREKKQNALNQVLQEKSEQLRLAETELISQSKLAALGQTFGGIAHEIRGPAQCPQNVGVLPPKRASPGADQDARALDEDRSPGQSHRRDRHRALESGHLAGT